MNSNITKAIKLEQAKNNAELKALMGKKPLKSWIDTTESLAVISSSPNNNKNNTLYNKACANVGLAFGIRALSVPSTFRQFVKLYKHSLYLNAMLEADKQFKL